MIGDGFTPTDAVLAAEQAVLGAAVLSRPAAETMTEALRPADFYTARHQLLAEAIDTLVESGAPVSPVAVLAELRRRGTLSEHLSGVDLHRVTEHRSTSVAYDARLIAEDALRRRLAGALSTAQQVVSDPGFESDRHVDAIRSTIDQAAAKVTGDQPPTIGELVMRRLDEMEGERKPTDLVPLPWADICRFLPGLRAGQLMVVGARPAVGKSVVGLDIARTAAIKHGLPVLLHSLEMTGVEVTDRLLAAEATVRLENLREQNLTSSDWTRIAKIQDAVLNAPLVVDDSTNTTLARIRARLRGMVRTDPAKLAIVDYLGLMATPKAESRERAVAELSRGLKLLGMEFGIPIVALHQLNRESLKRNDKRPTMADLRDSGAVEQDADIVVLLHREDAHDKESPRAGELDLIVDKNRSGPTGVATVAFQGHYARSVDMASGSWLPSGPHLRAVD